MKRPIIRSRRYWQINGLCADIFDGMNQAQAMLIKAEKGEVKPSDYFFVLRGAAGIMRNVASKIDAIAWSEAHMLLEAYEKLEAYEQAPEHNSNLRNGGTGTADGTETAEMLKPKRASRLRGSFRKGV